MSANVRSKALIDGVAADACAISCFNGPLVAAARARLPSADAAAAAARLFAALADPTRLRLLVALAAGDELCVCDLAHVGGVSISNASHHLRRLRDSGVLRHRGDGRMSYYSVRDRRLAEMAAALVAASEKAM